MAWIELHQTLPTNRKTMRFKRLLKIKTPQAVGHMCMLWLWAIDNAPDGDLSPFGADEIAEAGGYTGKDPHAFVDALVGAGFVDDDGTSLMIHEWYDYVGNLVDKRAITKAQNRERAQRYRDKRKQMSVTESVTERDDVTRRNADVTRDASARAALRNADVTRDASARAALRNADVTALYSTVPYSTNTVPYISEERKVKERSPEVQPATDVTPTDAVRPDVLETKNRLVVQADMPKGRNLDELPEGMRLADLPFIKLWRSKGRDVRTGTVMLAVDAYLRERPPETAAVTAETAKAGEARVER